jgi:hypothetical protein
MIALSAVLEYFHEKIVEWMFSMACKCCCSCVAHATVSGLG